MSKDIIVKVPDEDCDIILKFSSGKKVVIQARPSNADINYSGSLDIILPRKQVVILWKNFDMAEAPAIDSERQFMRLTKQIVTELP